MIQRFLLVLVVFFASIFSASMAKADEFRPAYLQLSQTSETTYDVLWKVPALDEVAILKVVPAFPTGATMLNRPRTSFADGIAVQRWTIEVIGGLEGKTIAFPGLASARIDVLARLTRSDGTIQLERVLPFDPRFVVEKSPGAFEVVQTYTLLGVEHILTGFDHLCFVLALLLIVGANSRLFWTITAFTLAHSITLALATLGVIHMPGPPVEAIIALSIVFVASEIVQQYRGREGLASKKPWIIAFTFGLLHGLGFAGALAQVGLPVNSIPLALLFFNIGVEIGQLLFIAVVLGAWQLMLRLAPRGRDEPLLRPLELLPAYVIGGLASYWVIARTSAFWS